MIDFYQVCLIFKQYSVTTRSTCCPVKCVRDKDGGVGNGNVKKQCTKCARAFCLNLVSVQSSRSRDLGDHGRSLTCRCYFLISAPIGRLCVEAIVIAQIELHIYLTNILFFSLDGDTWCSFLRGTKSRFSDHIPFLRESNKSIATAK